MIQGISTDQDVEKSLHWRRWRKYRDLKLMRAGATMNGKHCMKDDDRHRESVHNELIMMTGFGICLSDKSCKRDNLCHKASVLLYFFLYE